MVAAGVVASAGGLGGIGSLGQIASGPSLPDTGLETASSSSLEGAEIVGVDVPERVAPVPAAPAAGPLASAATAGRPATAPVSAERRSEAVPQGRIEPPTTTPTLTDPGGGSQLTPPGRNPPGGGRNPVEALQETTRGLGDSLPGPLGPITNNLIDLLLGPPPRR